MADVTYHLPPGPAPITSFIGIVNLLRRFSRNAMGTMLDFTRQYGDTYILRIGGESQVITSNPEFIYQITVAQASKFYKDRDYTDTKHGLARFLGNGLLTSDGEFWKRQRKLAAPALHARRIANYGQTMVDFTVKMLDHWRDGVQMNVAREMTDLTAQIVARTLFNTDVAADLDRISAAIEGIQAYSGNRSARLLPTWLPTPLELRARRSRRDLDSVIFRMIREWRVTRQDRGDLLSMLLLAQDEDGNGMTDEQARDEAVTIFSAGHETTANALSWTWYLLSQNPEVEAKLHEELDRVLAGRAPTLEDLEHLPYTEMVIKESLRLYPPAWGFGRLSNDEVHLGDYVLPKNTSFGVLTYFTHRDARLWEKPDAFIPERFSPENEKNLPKYGYLPFGGGPRICIGNAFALMEARLLLATIASRYRLTLVPGASVEMQPLITLNPQGGLNMQLHKRVPVSAPAAAPATEAMYA